MECGEFNERLEGTMSSRKLWLGIAAILLTSVYDAAAADLSRSTAIRKEAVVVAETQIECIRWVRQNQAWYNYCDPVPHFARTTYGDYWWDHRWYGYKARWYH
jgi:hypothetical protein